MRRATRLGAAALAVAAGALIAPGVASATTFTVNTTADGQDFNTADPFCDADFGTDGEQCTLRAAVEQTDAQPGPDGVVLPPGTYSLELGQLTIDDQVTADGAGAAVTTIRPDGVGRVLEVNFGAVVELVDLTIRDGVLADDGGGIRNHGETTLRRSLITNNQTAGAGIDGGGIWNGGTLTIEDSTISANAASPSGVGGGIANFNGVLEIVRSTLAGNTVRPSGPSDAAFGGGIWSSGTIAIDRSTLSGNAVEGAGAGGGIYNAVGPLEIASSTLARNSAPEGANIARPFPGAELTARNSIVAEPAGGGPSCFVDLAPPPTTHGYNLDHDGSCGFGAGPGNLAGTDPLLGPLADNGGMTMTHALLPGSPAIDAGLSAAGETTDQRGLARPIDLPDVANAGDGSDIGAFELQIPPSTSTSTTTRCKGRAATIVATSKTTKGTGGNDVIVGLNGKDKISGERGKDLVCAKAGNDMVKGGGGRDRLFGQGGKDKLNGGGGKDVLKGGGGKDLVAGGGGKDTCTGGPGKDRLRGCERGEPVQRSAARHQAVELELRARTPNTLRRLNVTASCFGGPCEVRVSGAAVAGDERFAIKPRLRSIDAGAIQKIGLRLKRRGAGDEIRELLDQGAKPTARIRAEATGADGLTDAARVVVKIRERRHLAAAH